jgi:hypothetical protein
MIPFLPHPPEKLAALEKQFGARLETVAEGSNVSFAQCAAAGEDGVAKRSLVEEPAEFYLDYIVFAPEPSMIGFFSGRHRDQISPSQMPWSVREPIGYGWGR